MNSNTEKLVNAARLARDELDSWLDHPAADEDTREAQAALCAALAEHDAAKVTPVTLAAQLHAVADELQRRDTRHGRPGTH